MMKKTEQGFTLIEIAASLAIGAILTLSVYQFFGNVRRGVDRMMGVSKYVLSVPQVVTQIDKDITAIFVPKRYAQQEQARKQNKNDNDVDKESKSTENKEKREQKIPHVFLLRSEKKDDNQDNEKKAQLRVLSFITTSTFHTYGEYGPHYVRVVYELLPHANNTGLYTLKRYETAHVTLPLEKIIKEVSGIEVLDNITSCTCSVYALKKQDKKGQDATSTLSQQSSKKEYVATMEWDPEKSKEISDVPIPIFVSLFGQVQDRVKDGYSFSVESYVASAHPFDPKHSEKNTHKKSETTSTTLGSRMTTSKKPASFGVSSR